MNIIAISSLLFTGLGVWNVVQGIRYRKNLPLGVKVPLFTLTIVALAFGLYLAFITFVMYGYTRID